MRTMLLATSLVFIGSALGCMKSSGDDDGGKTSTTSHSGAGGDAGASGAGGDGTGGDGASSSGGPITACTQATLALGDPYYDGDLGGWKPEGQPLLADPPIRARHLAAVGDHLLVDTQMEIWATDGGNVRRAAGDETEPETQFRPTGACADARFLILTGIAALPNGHAVATDIRGNGIVELTDPAGAGCTAAVVAGNAKTTLDVDIEDVADPGDVDGPGASAKFYGVRLPTADGAGNVYVVDEGNQKIKKIAADAARTVTTLHDFGSADEPVVLAMTVLGGKLYATGATATNDFLWELDTAKPGAPKVVYEKRGVFAEIDSSSLAILFAMDNDGEALIVGSNKGYVFRMSTAGEELAVLAGMGQIVDFPELDLSKPVPAAEVPLKGYGVNDGSVLKKGTSVLWAGGNGVGFHVFDIACK